MTVINLGPIRHAAHAREDVDDRFSELVGSVDQRDELGVPVCVRERERERERACTCLFGCLPPWLGHR